MLKEPGQPTVILSLQLRKFWAQRSMTSPVTCGPWVSSCIFCEWLGCGWVLDWGVAGYQATVR